MRRRVGVALVAAVLLAMTLGGWRLHAAPFPAATSTPPGAVATGPGSHAWYCAGATAAKGGQADGTLVLANAGRTLLTGTATVYANESGPQTPRPVTTPVALSPYSRGSLRLGSLLAAPFSAATVVFDGPAGSVELQVAGPLGVAAVPCATAPSRQWYLAAGTTRDGASDLLALFNPFPEDAIVDIGAVDDQGYTAPAQFQGIFVPAGSLVMVDLGAHLVQQSAVAVTVGVRVGRLVASQVQLDAISGEVGVSAVTAAPDAAASWWLPDGIVGPGLAEQLHVFNPTGATSHVTVEVHLARGEAAPFRMELAPQSQQIIDLSRQTRLPAGDDFTVSVRSQGAPVVVARTVQVGHPAARSGSAIMLGSPVTADHWQVTAGGATSAQDEWLVVSDPGSSPATVSVSYLDQGVLRPVPGLGQVVVPAGGHSQLRLGEHLQVADLTLMVVSNVAVVVERDLYQVTGPGVSLAIPSSWG